MMSNKQDAAINRPRRLPPWLRVKTGKAQLSRRTRELVHSYGLHTVCEAARCPNIGECYARNTATFMILGDVCTRNCAFCAISHGEPQPPDPQEPMRVAQAAAALGLKYVVITSVTRDDLPDGGAGYFAATISAIRSRLPQARVEVLTPDFQGDLQALHIVLAARPDVFNHNVETVRRLQPLIRPQADYDRSLKVLQAAAEAGMRTKSGLMVGLGETEAELQQTLEDLARVGVSIVTIGQYLQPTRRHLPVARYVAPEEFDRFAAMARQAGIERALCGPFVRSSYRAAECAD